MHATQALQWSLRVAETVLEAYPETIRARMVHANVLYRTGRHAEAAANYRAVLAAEPERVGALNNLAAILQAQVRA